MSDLINLVGDNYGKEFTREELYSMYKNYDLILDIDDCSDAWKKAKVYGVTEKHKSDELYIYLLKNVDVGLIQVFPDCRYNPFGEGGEFLGVNF